MPDVGKFSFENEIAVIGSGPGGSLTACNLAEAGRQVVILEEGPDAGEFDAPPFSREEMLTKYRNGGLTLAFGKPRIQYVEARCAGGGSEINSGLYYRLPEEMRSRWSAFWRVDGLGRAEMESHAAAIEKDLHVSPMPQERLPRPSLLLAEGAAGLGWKCAEVPRWHRYDGEKPGGERQTMTKTYLARARAAGAALLTGCRVLRLERRKNLWEIHLERAAADGRRLNETMRARTVFLAAGAIQTPLILRRSGLAKLAGRRLRMHPTLKVIAQFAEEVNFPGMGVPVHQIKEFGREMSMGCSISSPHYLAASLPEPGRREFARDAWRNLASYYVMITPEGCGRVSGVPFFRDAAVSYSLSKRDLAALSAGLERLCRVLFEAGAIRLFPTVNGLGIFEKAADLTRIPAVPPAKDASLMTIHLMGTCAMSEDASLAAADSWGRVHGAENLYVNDASLLCEAVGVNPQGAALAVARRNVLHWLEENRP